MKLKALSNPQFFQSLNKILRAEIPVKLAWKLKGVAKYLEDQNKSYDEMRRELLKKFGTKDDKGELKMADNGQVEFADGQKELFIKAHQELLDQDIELSEKIKIDDLATIKLSASDLLVLEELIEQ